MARNDLSAEYVRSVLDYNPETGFFTWKYREIDPKGWNKRFFGKIAGAADSYGYIIITVGHKPYKAHRLVWLYVTGEWPANEIDHIDLNKGNNIFSNLRQATNTQNMHNKAMFSNNTSGYKGVHLNKYGKWRAAMTLNSKTVNLGEYATAEEAYAVYCEAIKCRGEFMRTA